MMFVCFTCSFYNFLQYSDLQFSYFCISSTICVTYLQIQQCYSFFQNNFCHQLHLFKYNLFVSCFRIQTCQLFQQLSLNKQCLLCLLIILHNLHPFNRNLPYTKIIIFIKILNIIFYARHHLLNNLPMIFTLESIGKIEAPKPKCNKIYMAY